MVKPRFFKTRAAFRTWLETHHESTAALMLGFYKTGSGKGGITYTQALDEALCFGWIDGVRRSLDADRYEQRFTPRQRRSHWSQINLARVEELRTLGMMMPAGMAAWERRGAVATIRYSYETRAARFTPAMEQQWRANPQASAFFRAQPPGYRRLATFFVVSAKRQATQQARFARLLADCAARRRLGILASPRRKP